MRTILGIIIISIGIWASELEAQNYPGAPPGLESLTPRPSVAQPSLGDTPIVFDADTVYSLVAYTTRDLVIFNYLDDMFFYIYNSEGRLVDSAQLKRDQWHVSAYLQPGFYTIYSNQRFALLVGDPFSFGVQGFYAVDHYGRPLSTHLMTYFPLWYYGDERFIVFAYQDSTTFQLETLDNSYSVSGMLHRGEHFEVSDSLVNGKFLRVRSDKPVSALSYGDQGYYVPAANGTFIGTNFYGYSAYLGYWPNAVIAVAYQDSTEVIIRHTATRAILAKDTLQAGEVLNYTVEEPLYWTLESSQPVTVLNSPYGYYYSMYYYLIRHIDSTGTGVGTLFYCPVIASAWVSIYSQEDGNTVQVVDPSTEEVLATYQLDRGQWAYYYTMNKMVLRITGTQNLSVISWFGGSHGGDFSPLYFTKEPRLIDLAVKRHRMRFEPSDSLDFPGRSIRIGAWVYNLGRLPVEQAYLQFFDGPPEAGLPIAAPLIIERIEPGDSVEVYTQWSVPERPEYHHIYVKTWSEIGQERTLENNVAYQPLLQNSDLYMPVAVRWSSRPSLIRFRNNQPENKSLELFAELHNNSGMNLEWVSIQLNRPSGWSLADSSRDTVIVNGFGNGEKVSLSWKIRVDSLPDSDHAFYFSFLVIAGYLGNKTVKGLVHVAQVTAVDPAEEETFVSRFDLLPAYPNPFNPFTTVPFRIPRREHVVLEIYNIMGQRVATLLDREMSPGFYRIRFEPQQLGSGIYFIRMQAGAFQAVRKVVLMK